MTLTGVLTTPRIYVASLSDYNAGRLHGAWLDVSPATTTDDLYRGIAAMLAKGGGAEEWAIHDYDGFGPLQVSEYIDLAQVVAWGAAIAEHGEAVACFLANGYEVDEFEDAYCGEWDSEQAYAEQLADDLGYEAGDQWPGQYIDWPAATRDLFLCDYWSAPTPTGGVYVYRSV